MTRITLKGTDVNYETRGKGPALILLHGWNSSHEQWSRNLRALAKGFRVIVPDLPGHGDSALPPYFDYSLEAHVGWLEEFRKAMRLKDFGLVGHSLGGSISAAYTAAHPERVRALVLCATPASGRGLSLRNRIPGAEALVSLTYGLRGPWMLAFIMLRGVYKSEQLEKDFVQTNVLQMRKITRRTLTRTARLARTADLRPRLSSITTPTLVVCGNKDHTVREREARILTEGITGSHLLSVNGVAHCPPCEKPDVFNTAVRDFMLLAYEATTSGS